MSESTRKASTSSILSDAARPRNPQHQKDSPIAQNSRQDGDHTHSEIAKRRKKARSYSLRDSEAARSELFSTSDPPPYLQIVSVPIAERIDPERNSYILVIQPHGVRAAGGQYAADECHEIAKITRGWDWTLDENQRPVCLPQLERLLDRICKRSPEISDLMKGGEG